MIHSQNVFPQACKDPLSTTMQSGESKKRNANQLLPLSDVCLGGIHKVCTHQKGVHRKSVRSEVGCVIHSINLQPVHTRARVSKNPKNLHTYFMDAPRRLLLCRRRRRRRHFRRPWKRVPLRLMDVMSDVLSLALSPLHSFPPKAQLS